ncbi:MAG: DNA/RNA nuclease SfsA, partial [Thermus sp.]|nr:DNA/RNA nuclease SfsA [Thermus sp.]
MLALPLPPLKPCRFIRRKNRFLVEADVGPLHLANSGRMAELLLPKAPCFYHPRATPKTVGRMMLVESQGVLVGVDASMANGLLEVLLREGFSLLGQGSGPDPGSVRKEVRLGGERMDFGVRIGGKEALLEAKNCNRVEGGLALFPDAPTARGARHLRLLGAFARGGGLAYAVWMVQHPLAQAFALDPEDGPLYRAAREA